MQSCRGKSSQHTSKPSILRENKHDSILLHLSGVENIMMLFSLYAACAFIMQTMPIFLPSITLCSRWSKPMLELKMSVCLF